MIHRLTVGLLDTSEVRRRHVEPLGNLPGEVRALAAKYADSGTNLSSGVKFEGAPVIVTNDYVECVWLAPLGVNRTSASSRQRRFGPSAV